MPERAVRCPERKLRTGASSHHTRHGDNSGGSRLLHASARPSPSSSDLGKCGDAARARVAARPGTAKVWTSDDHLGFAGATRGAGRRNQSARAPGEKRPLLARRAYTGSAPRTAQSCGLRRAARASAVRLRLRPHPRRPSHIIRSRHHVQIPEIQQGSEKTRLADTEGKEGRQAGEEACGGYHPADRQRLMSVLQSPAFLRAYPISGPGRDSARRS